MAFTPTRFFYFLLFNLLLSVLQAQPKENLDSLLENCYWLADTAPAKGLQESLAIYEKASQNNSSLSANKALVWVGSCLIQKSLYDSAISVLQKPLEFFAVSEQPYGIYTRYYMAEAHYYLGEYLTAKSILLEILLQEHITENRMHIKTLHLLGEVNRAAGIFSIAKDYFFQALQLSRLKKDIKREAAALNRLGYTSYQLNQHDSAIYYLKKSLTLCNTYHLDELKVSNYNDLGEIYNSTKKFDKAIELYNTALQTVTDKEQLTNTRLNLAWTYREIQDYEKAISQGEKALALARETNIISYESSSLEILATIHRDLGKHDQAAQYYKQYLDLLTKLESKGNPGKMNQLEIAYRTRQVELQMENLQIQAAAEKKQNLLYYGSAILVLLLGGIIAIINWRLNKARAERESKARELAEANANIANAERKRAEEKLEFQRRELTRQTLNLMRQTEFINQLKHEIELKKGENLGSLKKILKEEQLQQQDWDHFDKSFKELHPSFLKSLLAQNANLTLKEIRLIALLKLGMNNREIAQLLSINQSSINQAKYRLKKKLQLDAEQSLDHFIQNLL